MITKKELIWVECDFVPPPMHYAFPFDKNEWKNMSEEERTDALKEAFIKEMGEEYYDTVDEFEIEYFVI